MDLALHGGNDETMDVYGVREIDVKEQVETTHVDYVQKVMTMEREPIYNSNKQHCGYRGWMYSFLDEEVDA